MRANTFLCTFGRAFIQKIPALRAEDIGTIVGTKGLQFSGSPTTGGGGGGEGLGPTFLQIMPLKGSASSFAVVIFWHQSLAPLTFLISSEALILSLKPFLVHKSSDNSSRIVYPQMGPLLAVECLMRLCKKQCK